MSFDAPNYGKSVIVSAPSGAGKTTLVRCLMEAIPALAFSISGCSRDPRANETHGKDYYFLGLEGFKQAIQNDAFIEWEEVYQDHYYGTLKSEVNRLWDEGKVVIFDVDVVGGLNLKSLFKDRSLALFIEPPSISVLKERLTSRETESADRIALRIEKAGWELAQSSHFDVRILNEDLPTAVSEAIDRVTAFLAL